MFPRNYRLPLGKKQGFQKTFSAQQFLLKTSMNSVGHNRFGIIISNAAVKKSTRRHFWKRRFVEFVRAWPNIQRDFLVIVSPNINTSSPKDIKKELDKMLKFLAPHN